MKHLAVMDEIVDGDESVLGERSDFDDHVVAVAEDLARRTHFVAQDDGHVGGDPVLVDRDQIDDVDQTGDELGGKSVFRRRCHDEFTARCSVVDEAGQAGAKHGGEDLVGCHSDDD